MLQRNKIKQEMSKCPNAPKRTRFYFRSFQLFSLSKREIQSKPLTIRQHALASVLNPSSRSPSPEPLTYVQEQSALRKEAIEAFHSATKKQDEPMDEEESDDDLLVLREKTKDEIEKEEEEYRDFLQREVGEDLEGLITLEPGDSFAAEVEVEPPTKKKKKSKEKAKPKEEDDQEFLMKYVPNFHLATNHSSSSSFIATS